MAKAEDIAHRFQYHAPDTAKGEKHAKVRELLGNVAQQLNQDVPEGREQALMITHLEEAMFWANAGIARSFTP